LFDHDSYLTPNNTPKIVAACRVQQAEHDRRRDVYDSHRHRVFALSFYMTGSEIDAETILTQTFIRAFSASAEPSGQQVDSALIEELQQRYPLGEQHLAAIADARFQAGARLAGRNVLRTELEEAIQTLPPTERLLFLLRDVEGYTPSAISELLHIPEVKVQRALFSARLRLRQTLAGIESSQREAA
jgi:RNA polymerase sigma-70 factor, ECF subfamily